ncbi:MAG: hypothetical protein AB1742_16310 [bacterium]
MMIGLALVAVFLAFAALMYLGKLPALIALPLMAAALFIAGGIFHYGVRPVYPGSHAVVLAKDFFGVVIAEGTVRLANVMVTIILGAVLAELLKASGVSKAMIRWASELGGDSPVAVCFLLTGATAVLFTTLGGLGAVIMVATLVMPIMLSAGVGAEAAGCLFLLGLSLGGTFNPANWAVYIGVLGLTQAEVFRFAAVFGAVFAAVASLFLIVNLRRGVSSFWAMTGPVEEPPRLNPLALLTPVVPILLLVPFNVYNLLEKPPNPYYFPINAALFAGIVFGVVTTFRTDGGNVQRLTRCAIEGVSASAPAIALLVGIGMILNAVTHPAVGGFMEPILKRAMPQTLPGYVAVFSLLAPLALYRGPLNIYGMGAGLAGVMLATGTLPPAAIMGALLSVGMIQGVSDPTNTHNAWLAGYLGKDVMVFTRKTLPYMWGLAAAGLLVAGAMFL